MFPEVGSGAPAKAAVTFSPVPHATLPPGEDTGTLTFTASRHPEEGLQDGAELRLQVMNLSRIAEIYIYTAWYSIGLSK